MRGLAWSPTITLVSLIGIVTSCVAVLPAACVSTRVSVANPPQRSVVGATPGGSTIRRSYDGFRQLADEAARSRIYGGIHFTFESPASLGVCIPLGDYVFTNVLRPRFP